LPILIGLKDDSDPIVVAADAPRRLGRLTRFSVRFPETLIQEARLRGWAEFVGSTGEHIVAFRPSLLPVFVEARAAAISLDADRITDVIAGSGLLEDDDEAARERARRATTALIRDQRFAGAVLTAYDKRCALCGLDLGLVSAAHIYPVSAPGSPDKVWNGVLLCDNHHRAFDAHILHIDPDDKRVIFHPSVLAQAKSDHVIESFVDGTQGRLTLPARTASRPRREMFEKRYEHLRSRYEWAA
jgi:hypothetical protein